MLIQVRAPRKTPPRCFVNLISNLPDSDGSEIQVDMLDLPFVLAHPGRRLRYTCQVVWECRRVLPALQKRFPDTALPKVVFTDRGLGFFHPNGAITAEWQAGLKEAGMRAYLSKKKPCV